MFFLARFFEPPVFSLYVRIRTNATCCLNLLSWVGCRSFYKWHLQYLVFFARSNGKNCYILIFFLVGGRGLIFNSPFPSCSKPLFQTEAKCKAIAMKMILYCPANKIHFHKKGFPLSLALKVRDYETRNWPYFAYNCDDHVFI